MSRFTNDVDTVGQMLSSTLVQLFSGALSIIGTLALMIYTNIWLTLVTVFMIPLMMKAGGAVAGKSQKYFSAQQTLLGAVNGYIEETITGQKVVKVFCHEDIAEEEFEILNEDLRDNMIKAQFFGGMMGPVMSNLSQLNYTLTAAIGGLLCVLRGFDVGGLTVFFKLFQAVLQADQRDLHADQQRILGSGRCGSVCLRLWTRSRSRWMTAMRRCWIR